MEENKTYPNILFLDYDGVINIEKDNFYGYFENPEAIYFIGKFCKENDFQIVVTSSWKNNPQYKDFLYDSGLDKKVKILGCTNDSNKGREYEIQSYLDTHPEIEEFIIIDDAYISGDLREHQVQTTFELGYTKEKYEETLVRLKSLYGNKFIEIKSVIEFK